MRLTTRLLLESNGRIVAGLEGGTLLHAGSEQLRQYRGDGCATSQERPFKLPGLRDFAFVAHALLTKQEPAGFPPGVDMLYSAPTPSEPEQP